MPHVVPAHDVRAVGQAPRMPVVRRTQQQDGGVDGAAGDDHDVRAELHGRALAAPVPDRRDDRGDAAAGRVRLQAPHVRVGDHLDVVVFQGGVDTDDLRVGLRADQAGEAVDTVAADAGAGVGGPAPVVLGEVHPDRQVEGVQSLLLQVVAQLLDARLVLDRRIRVLGAGGTLGRILAVPAVDEVEVLGLGVVRLEFLVAQRPGGGEAVVVAELAEVLGTHTEERGAVELGVAAHVVIDLGRELVSVFVVPEFRCAVFPFDEDGGGIPVVAFTRKIVPAFEKENSFPRGRQSVGDRATTRTGADNDDVVMLRLGHAGHRPHCPAWASAPTSKISLGDNPGELVYSGEPRRRDTARSRAMTAPAVIPAAMTTQSPISHDSTVKTAPSDP